MPSAACEHPTKPRPSSVWNTPTHKGPRTSSMQTESLRSGLLRARIQCQQLFQLLPIHLHRNILACSIRSLKPRETPFWGQCSCLGSDLDSGTFTSNGLSALGTLHLHRLRVKLAKHFYVAENLTTNEWVWDSLSYYMVMA